MVLEHMQAVGVIRAHEHRSESVEELGAFDFGNSLRNTRRLSDSAASSADSAKPTVSAECGDGLKANRFFTTLLGELVF